MGRIEKTVFISYRRTNFWTALAIYQDLYKNGYDVFFDYKSIPSGDFEKVITENVKYRAHFIVVLSPSALERCNEPGDWLRREIELAIDNQRNIIPLMMEGFDFGSPATTNALTGKLAELKKYNALGIPAEYFEEAMVKLRSERFLNRPLESVSHPISDITKEITEKQKSAAKEAAPVEKEQLTAQEWFERGYIFAVEIKNYDEAIRCFSETIKLQPNDALAYYNRGRALDDQNKLDEAIGDYNEAVRFRSDHANTYIGRGNAHKAKGDFYRAIQDYNEAIRLEPDNAIAYNNRGAVYNNKGDLDWAIQDFDEAIRHQPVYAEAYINRGAAYKAKGDLDRAIQDFNEAISIQPDSAQALYYRGNVRLSKGDVDGSIQDFNDAISFQPDYAQAYNYRGVARVTQGDLDGALQDFDETIRLKHDFVLAFNMRGNIYRTKGNLDDAIQEYDEAIRIQQENAPAFYERGLTYQMRGNFDHAEEDYQESLRINPNDNIARMYLFNLLKKLGKDTEVDEHEQLARELAQKESEYNQACFEALCNNTEEALDLLKIALEKGQASKEWAKQDPDLFKIRDDSRFEELVDE